MAVTELTVEGVVFPPVVGRKHFLAGGGVRGMETDEGNFVKIAAIGVYLEDAAVPALARKWAGKTADELASDPDFFRDVHAGEFEKLTRVTFVWPRAVPGEEFSAKVMESRVAYLKATGAYTDAEAAAVEEFKAAFKTQSLAPGGSVFFTHSPAGVLTMPPHPRMSAAQYIARFKPQEPHVDGDQEISDAESRVGDTAMENSVMGWTTKLHIMVPKADVFFHDMLTRTLDNYYYDWEAMLEYRCKEYSHPLMDSYWETELWIKTMDPTTKEPNVESKFITRVSRATVETSMEDVAYNVFVFYHGLRSDKMLQGALRHFPCFLHDKGVWIVPLADDSSLTLQATVGLVRELALHEVDLKDELLKENELKEQAYKEIDKLRAELGHPKIYEKLN